MKKILRIVALLTLVFTAFNSFSGISKAESKVNKAEQILVSGTAQKSLLAHYNNVTSNELETLKKISNENPNVKLKIKGKAVDIVTVFPAVQGSVYVNGTPADVENGKFTATVDKGQVNIQLIDSGEVISKKTLTLQKNTKDIKITNKKDFNSYIDDMDKKNQKMNMMKSEMDKYVTMSTTNHMDSMSNMDNMSDMNMDSMSKTTADSNSIAITPYSQCAQGGVCGTVYPGQKDGQYVSPGTHVHCNRFNGKNSDHRYWTHSHPQAYINYVGSDCYIGGGGYDCGSFTHPDTSCDGLNTQGMGVHDCSIVFGYPVTAWYRN